MKTAKSNFNFQKIIFVVGIALLILKIVAWYITNSVAILTDALESIINVIAGFVGLYSLYLSAQPKDHNHPYGHGKVEFVSAAIEGTLISVAGLLIIYKSLLNLRHPILIHQLDLGMVIIGITAIINFLLGTLAIKKGVKNNSMALVASGKHLQSDTYTTVGIIVGLITISITHLIWLDSLVALIFAFVIIFTGYKIIRASLAGIMDEADEDLLQNMVDLLEKNRIENWIDLHNLRIIKYGGTLHLDCHMTVPWFLNVHEAHKEIDALSLLVKNNFGKSLELFVHTDGCLDFSCKICNKQNCDVRKFNFEKKIVWTVENISADSKHKVI